MRRRNEEPSKEREGLLMKKAHEKTPPAKAESNVSSASCPRQDGVIHVPTRYLLLSACPLLIIIYASWEMELDLAGPIISGATRTFVQLSILSTILGPIFKLQNKYLVVGYCLFMVTLAAHASCGRAKYTFDGQFTSVFGSLFINVALVGSFAFAVVIRPKPVFNPQYVIPITGMLLGNCVTGISLTMNNLTIALAERQAEIELYLSFGATSYEAVSRLLSEAVRSGTMPILNSMSVIGIVAIPGMMTGQILGGSPVADAARYQILIMYLIAVTTFGVILMEVWCILSVGFDASHMLLPDQFQKAPNTLGLVGMAWAAVQSKISATPSTHFGKSLASKPQSFPIDFRPTLQIQPMYFDPIAENSLLLDRLNKYFTVETVDEGGSLVMVNRTLFQDLSFTVGPGQIVFIKGPSGCGKSQLLRSISSLSPLNAGHMSLEGVDWSQVDSKSTWRRHVRYVTQYKVDIAGTPIDFVKRISSFKAWQADTQSSPVSEHEIITSAAEFVSMWGLKPDCLEKEWSVLSGGEAQRVIVALALASKPSVLLLDESTSALDLTSKLAVENTINDLRKTSGMKVLMVSHDIDQSDRMSAGG